MPIFATSAGIINPLPTFSSSVFGNLATFGSIELVATNSLIASASGLSSELTGPFLAAQSRSAQAAATAFATDADSAIQILKNTNNLLATAGQQPQSLEELLDRLQTEGPSGKLLTKIGIAYARKNDFSSAIEAYDLALRFERHPRTLCEKAMTLRKAGRALEGLELLDEAILLESGTKARSFYEKAIILRKVNRYDDALAAIEEAIKVEPASVRHYCEKAIILRLLARLNEALKIIKKAIRMDPKQGRHFCEQAIILRGLGRTDEALVAIEEAIRLDPTKARHFSELAVILKELGRADEALVAIKEAIRLNPKEANFFAKK